MKRILKLIAISVIALMMFFALVKPVEAISDLNLMNEAEEFLSIDIERYRQQEWEKRKAWEEQYANKKIFLENSMYVVTTIIVFNIILFSILINKSKNSKIDLIYKILQIIFLVLICVLYKIWDEIPGMPGGTAPAVISWKDQLRSVILNDALIISINLFVTIFIKKRSYLLGSSILFAVIFYGFLFIGYNIEVGFISLFILTNIIFLPLHLKKKKLKEEENVRI